MITIVWVLVTMGGTNVYNVGPEFTSKEKCKVAAQAVHKAVDQSRLFTMSREPICVKIEK